MNSHLAKSATFGLHWIAIPTIAIAMNLWPTLSSGLEKLQVDAGDTLLNLYFLEHAYQHLAGISILSPEQYWSPEIFWPIKGTLAWSDHLLGPSLLYSIFRKFGDQYQSYTAWLILTLWLNYISMRVALAKIAPKTTSMWISIASLITAFSPTIIQQLNHPQLLSLFLIGPIIFQCHRLIHYQTENFSLTDWIKLSTLILALGFFNIYIFAYACYGTLICLFVHVARRIFTRNSILKLGKGIKTSLAALCSISILNALIYIPYLNTISTFGGRSKEEIVNNLPKISSWVFGDSRWLIPPPTNPSNFNLDLIYGSEQQIFPGWPLLILLAGASITIIWKFRNDSSGLKVWGLVSFLTLALSLSVNDVSIWPYISKAIPGASALRASSRVSLIIVLFTSPMIALATSYWKPIANSLYNKILAMLTMVACMIGIYSQNHPSFSLEKWKKEMYSISEKLANSNCSIFWYQWSNQEDWRANVLAMHVQLYTRIPTLNGNSGHLPRGNWPDPSGKGAFAWAENKAKKIFKTRATLDKKSTKCIVSMDTDYSVTIHRSSQIIPSTITRPDNIIYSGAKYKIGTKLNQYYIKFKDNSNQGKWILLNYEGRAQLVNDSNFNFTGESKSLPGQPSMINLTAINNDGVKLSLLINKDTGEIARTQETNTQ